MIKSFIAAITLVVVSPFASAYSIVETETLIGKIESVDPSSNSLVVQRMFGDKEAVSLKSYANIYFDGERAALTDLQGGEKIRIKRTTYSPTTEQIEGEIVSIDHKNRTASIRVAYQEVVKVKFSEKVTVKGAVKSSDFESLRKGHLVVVSAK